MISLRRPPNAAVLCFPGDHDVVVVPRLDFKVIRFGRLPIRFHEVCRICGLETGSAIRWSDAKRSVFS